MAACNSRRRTSQKLVVALELPSAGRGSAATATSHLCWWDTEGCNRIRSLRERGRLHGEENKNTAPFFQLTGA